MPDQLPIDLLHWGMAVLPILALLVLLAGLRWKAPEAGPIGMFLAAIIAVLVFQSGLDTLAIAAGKGIWDAAFILFVVWPALLLYGPSCRWTGLPSSFAAAASRSPSSTGRRTSSSPR